ncbi:hypothetical protein PoB_000948400 [Plakobranchus ocellatus]|uniref:Uncharacterized protein n=1 Tax=Plakobranchus ocellatus TaxID=259542 RepID=A0AAV3YIZ0_9GAST|nr:hypothetical protein PoB_000948400 [Plakobranchus ocellatus]
MAQSIAYRALHPNPNSGDSVPYSAFSGRSPTRIGTRGRPGQYMCNTPRHSTLYLRGNKYNVTKRAASEKYFQIVEMPTDFLQPGWTAASKHTNDIHHPRTSSEPRSAYNHSGDHRRAVHPWSRAANAAGFLTDPNLPAVSAAKTVTIQIDLSEYNSMQFFEPTEVDMATSHLTIGPYMLPHGYIRVSILFEENGQLVYTCYRYFKVNFHSVFFHEHKEPRSKVVYWPLSEDVWINTSASFFASRNESYGFLGDLSSLPYAVSMTNITYSCTGIARVCSNYKVKANIPMFYVSKKILEQINLSTEGDTIVINETWHYEDFHEQQRITSSMPTTFVFRKSHLIVDIICIRNCGYFQNIKVPLILMAKCLNCEGDPSKIVYRWSYLDQGANKKQGPSAKYWPVPLKSVGVIYVFLKDFFLNASDAKAISSLWTKSCDDKFMLASFITTSHDDPPSPTVVRCSLRESPQCRRRDL